MTPERYRQINELADAALEIAADRRAAFLDEICGSDHELRRQIEALISADSPPGGFLEKPVLDVLARDMLARSSQRDLAGRRIEDYEVISRLGAGGIGEVWLARDLNLNREVALKLLWPKFAGDPYHVRRFQQEARAASALNHPNIVTVYEIGKSEGVAFIAEERVAGETIRQRLARGPIPLKEAVDIGRQAASALTAAHAAGVVHRDIKPENVILRPDGLVKVLDFGLARFVERPAVPGALGSDSLSLPGFVLGTVRYMSPEQARGLPVDGRSDVFSLGVMLYEMAAGTVPFSGPTATDTLAAILTAEPAPISRYLPSVPADFERIVRRCLAKEPAGRYASIDELREDLAGLAARLGRPRPTKAWGAAGILALLLIVAAAWLLTARKQAPESFSSMRITRVVARGEAADAALSPSGKLLAYVVKERGGESIWIRSRPGPGEMAAVPPETGEHSGLVFSPDDAYLYFRRRNTEDSGSLYRVPVAGRGAAELVLGDVSGAAALSPDGRRLAFVRLTASNWEASLIVANADGTGAFTVATLRRPRYFDQHTVAWSPDGQSIACFTGEAARYSDAVFHLVEFRLSNRTQHLITPQSWTWPRSVAWSSKGGHLIVTAASRGDVGYQLWTVAHRDGRVARLTNDLSNYDRVTVTADGTTLATVQSETSAGIWVAAADGSGAHRISAAPLRSSEVSLAWTPGGGIIYSEAAGDDVNLWAIDQDDRTRRQLTFGPGEKSQIAITRDGRYIIYKRAGNIWRMDTDGTNERRLTSGRLDVHPDVSPDGRSIIYASFGDWSPGIGGQPTLWRAPIDGGTPVEISQRPASYPRISAKGDAVAFVYYPSKDPRFSAHQLAVLSLDHSDAFRVYDDSPSDETALSWSPDGKALDYIVNSGGVGNLWSQPVDGGPARQITSFAADELYGFAWSPDGRLACARGATTTGVVLIDHFR